MVFSAPKLNKYHINIICVPYILLELLLLCVNHCDLCHQKIPSVPINTPRRGQITRPQPPLPLPPPPALVKYIVGSDNAPLQSAILFSGLHGTHPCIAASSPSLVNVDVMCINSNITSNNFFSSFNNIDPSHMMLVDFCMLCCQGCGPIAAAYDGGGQHGPSSLITFCLAFYLGHKPQVRQAQVRP
jgi:hypothetical protein